MRETMVAEAPATRQPSAVAAPDKSWTASKRRAMPGCVSVRAHAAPDLAAPRGGIVLRIGILGAARITPIALVKPARRVGGARRLSPLRPATGPERPSSPRKQGIPRVLESYVELINDPDIDAVYNPLPNGLHGHWTIAALEAGKHVLCEKPFTANADEARSVAEA